MKSNIPLQVGSIKAGLLIKGATMKAAPVSGAGAERSGYEARRVELQHHLSAYRGIYGACIIL